MDFLTQLLDGLAQFEAWMDAESWRWVAAGVLEALVWGAGAYLIWRRAVEARARELTPWRLDSSRLGETTRLVEPSIKITMDDRASGALRRMGAMFVRAGDTATRAMARQMLGRHLDPWPDPPTHPNCRSTGDRDAEKREWAARVVRGIAAFAPTAGHAIAGIRQAFGFSGKLDRLSDPIDVHTRDGQDLQFRVNLDVDPEDVRRAVDEWTEATPAHPNYRSETPQADELERLLDEIRPGKGLHEHGRTSVPARPMLRPALEGVDIHERAKRARANMVEACAAIGVSARQAGDALAYLGRALKDTVASMEVENEFEDRPRSAYGGAVVTVPEFTGRTKYTLKIQGGERIAVLMFADTKELRWFAEVYRSAKAANPATDIEIAWAWSEFRQRHSTHPSFGLPDWIGGVVAERRDAPEVIRFSCGTYMMREWGWDDPSNAVVRPAHGGKCPACAEAVADPQAPQIRFSAHAIADMARAAAEDGVDYDERMKQAESKIEDMVRERETRG